MPQETRPAFRSCCWTLMASFGRDHRAGAPSVNQPLAGLANAVGTRATLILGDRVQLQQIINNLAMNGIEAMESVAVRRRELVIQHGQEATGRRIRRCDGL